MYEVGPNLRIYIHGAPKQKGPQIQGFSEHETFKQSFEKEKSPFNRKTRIY